MSELEEIQKKDIILRLRKIIKKKYGGSVGKFAKDKGRARQSVYDVLNKRRNMSAEFLEAIGLKLVVEKKYYIVDEINFEDIE